MPPKKKQTVKALSRRVSALETKPELKHAELEVSTTYGSTGSILHLTPIAQGDQSNEREGLQCHVKDVYGRGAIIAGAAGQIVRLIVFVDKDNNGVALTLGDILENYTNDIHSPLNDYNRHRFRVLMDKVWVADSTNALTATRAFKWHRKVNSKAYYSGTAAGNYLKGNVFCLVLTNTAGSHPTLQMITRCRFTD